MPTTTENVVDADSAEPSAEKSESLFGQFQRVLKDHDLALANEYGIAIEHVQQARPEADGSLTYGILRGAEPVYGKERRFLIASRQVRLPRPWIGSITVKPIVGGVRLVTQAYGPKGAESLDKETGKMLLIDDDDSFVIISNILPALVGLHIQSVSNRSEYQVREEEFWAE